MSDPRGRSTVSSRAVTRRTVSRDAALTILGAVLLAVTMSDLSTALTSILLVCLVVLASVNPRSSLFLVAFALPFAPLEVRWGALRFSVLEVAVLVSVIGTVLYELVTFVRSPRRRAIILELLAVLGSSSFTPLGLGLLAVGTASLGVVAAPEHVRESLREWRWVVVEPVAWYAVALWMLRQTDDRRRLVSWWVAGAAVASLVSVLQWLSGGGLATEGVRRLVGLYSHPNAAALILERPAVVAATLALFCHGRQRIVWGASGTVLGLAALLTFSRGAWAALAVTLGIAAVVTGYRRLALLVAAGSVLALLGAVAFFPDRFRTDLAGGSEALRLAIWRSTVHMILDRPLTGVGLDQFLYQYAPRYVEPVAWPERFTSHPHNLVLDAWVRLGIGGVVLLGVAAWLFVRAFRQQPCPYSRAVILGTLAGLIHGFVDRAYFAPELALSFWLAAVILDLPRTAPSAADEGGR